jgi:hypothetical protein
MDQQFFHQAWVLFEITSTTIATAYYAVALIDRIRRQ